MHLKEVATPETDISSVVGGNVLAIKVVNDSGRKIEGRLRNKGGLDFNISKDRTYITYHGDAN